MALWTILRSSCTWSRMPLAMQIGFYVVMSNDPFGIAGLRVLITGGTQNIGFETARVMGAAGAHVTISGRTREKLEAARTRISTSAARVAALELPLGDISRLEEVVATREDLFGSFDVLINNAAARHGKSILDTTIDEWRAIFETNLNAPFLLAKAVLPGMESRGFGRIINISGVDSYSAPANRSAMSASKAALGALSRSIAKEGARHGITACTLVLGPVDTERGTVDAATERQLEDLRELVPLRRFALPVEVANVCLFLASPAGSYFTGRELFLTGGL